MERGVIISLSAAQTEKVSACARHNVAMQFNQEWFIHCVQRHANIALAFALLHDLEYTGQNFILGRFPLQIR